MAELRAFLDGGDAAREGESWLQAQIPPQLRAGWPNNGAKIERYRCGGDNHMAVLWDGLRPLASYTVLRDDMNRSKLLLWLADSPGAAATPQVPVTWALELNGITLSRHESKAAMEAARAALMHAIAAGTPPAPGITKEQLKRWHDFAAGLMREAGVESSKVIGEMYSAYTGASNGGQHG